MSNSRRNLVTAFGIVGIVALLLIALLSSDNVNLFGTAGDEPTAADGGTPIAQEAATEAETTQDEPTPLPTDIPPDTDGDGVPDTNDACPNEGDAGFGLTADGCPLDPPATPVPPTDVPATDVPPTDVPPTDVPPTDVPPTDVPATDVPPTDVPATDVPPTDDTASVSSDDPTAEAPTPLPTDTLAPTETQEPTEVPPTDTEVPTELPDPTDKAVEEETDEPAEQQPLTDKSGTIACQLEVNNAADTNPFTWGFEATNVEGINSYEWDFGDGNTATGQVVSHTYATTGDYTIALKCVVDGINDLDLPGSVSITSTTGAAFNVSPGLSGITPFNVTMINNSVGDGLTHQWTVTGISGDAATGPTTFSSTDAAPSFNFTVWGDYSVELIVTDAYGYQQIATATIGTVPPAPIVDFTISPNPATIGDTVTITGFIVGGGPLWDDAHVPPGWSFDFGNTATGVGMGPHTTSYAAEMNYNVTLFYSGPGGGGSINRQAIVFADTSPVDAIFTWAVDGTYAGPGVRVCFTNISDGPVATSTWNFGDGTIVTDNSATVCHVYAVENNFTTRLDVSSGAGSTSNATQTVKAFHPPLAAFSITPASGWTWDDVVNFTDESTGEIDVNGWEWDFNNDGTIDSTVQNPSTTLSTIGNQTIKLTVTGPGGSSSVEMLINVAVRDITCDFNNPTNLAPQTSNNFVSTVQDLRTRTATYLWTVTGPDSYNQTFTTEDLLNYAWPAVEGQYTIQLDVDVVEDSADCSTSKTIEVEWPTLVCDFGTNFAPVPNGTTSYTYTPAVTGIGGRAMTYEWFLDGASQGTSATYTLPPQNVSGSNDIRMVATADNGSGDCTTTKTVTWTWPTLTCVINGSKLPGTNPTIPTMPDSTRTYNYTVTVNGAANRTLTYAWSGETTSSADNVTLEWQYNEEGSKTLNLTVTADNNDTTTVDCNTSATINVQVPTLTCGIPSGDNTPVINETVTYGPTVGNLYGRPIDSYTWELVDLADDSVVASGTNSTQAFQFTEPAKTYRIRYTVVVTNSTSNPDTESCSGQKNITTPVDAEVGYSCDGWAAGNNYSPANSGGSYAYNYEVDNTNNYNLVFDWSVSGTNKTSNFNVDGIHTSPAFTGVELGPVGFYTLTVNVSSPDIPYTCSDSVLLNVGTINVNFGYTVSLNNTQVEVGEQICLNNTSSTSHSDITGMTYEWDLDGDGAFDDSTAEQPGCINFSTPGTYVVKLRGTNLNGDKTATRNVTFNVWGSQYISINKTNADFAPANITFDAVGTNITGGYTWTFFNSVGTQINSGSGQSVTRNFATGGTYRAVVIGTGPLGQTQAEVYFTLLNANDIRAAFRPSIYAFVAPQQVCFEDRSVGEDIVQWDWDFGNGQTASNTDGSTVCSDYTNGGQVYTVTLNILNDNALTASATNIVRAYNAIESASTFSIVPQGNGAYCFTAYPAGGASVSEWTMGDGTIIGSGNLNNFCYTYQAAGSYLVTMKLGTDGEVVRPLDVDLSTSTPPALSVVPSCSATRIATFVVTNNGGSMTVEDTVRVYNNAGTLILISSIKLNAGASQTFNIPDQSGTVTFTTVDTAVNVSTDCEYPPQITVTSDCVGNVPQFTINNADGPMISSQSYTVTDVNSTTVASGNFQIVRGGPDVVITITGANPYQPYTFVSNGVVGNFTVLESACAPSPSLDISSLCNSGTPTFTITNNGDDMVISQTFTIVDGGGNDVTPAINSFQLNAGGTLDVPLTGLDPYDSYTLTISGFVNDGLAYTHNCDDPVLTISSVCSGTPTFTITNTGTGNMLSAQTFTILDGDGNDVTPAINSFQLNASGTLDVPLTGLDPYASYTLTISGFASNNTSYTHDCDNAVLNVTSICTGTPTFTISNTGSGDMLTSQTFTITDAGGNDITPTLNSFQLNSGGSVDVALTGFDPYQLYTLNISGFAGGTTTYNHNCDDSNIQITSTCSETPTFTIANTGVGDMLTQQTFTIVDGSGNDVTPVNNTFQLTTGGSMDVALTGLDPYDSYTINVVGFSQGTSTYTHDCDDPQIVVASVCSGTPTFTLSNNGAGDMLGQQTFTIVSGNGTDVTPANNTFQFNSGAAMTVELTGLDPYDSYTLTINGFANGGLSYTHDCDDPALGISSLCTSVPPTFTIVNSGPGTMLTSNTFTIVDGSGNDVTPANNTFQLTANGSVDIPLTGLDLYEEYTLSVTTSYDGSITSYTHSCAQPMLSVTTCNYGVDFVIVNNGASMVTSQTYTVVDASGNDVTPANNIINLASGEVMEIDLSGSPYDEYTLTSTGVSGSISTTSDCADPLLSVISHCSESLSFSILNEGAAMLEPQSYTLINGNGVDITPANNMITLNAGESTQITIPGANPYDEYVLTSGGFAGALDLTQDCGDPILSLDPASVCTTTPTFIITNTGSNMLSAQSVTIRNSSGQDVTPANNSFVLASGQSHTIMLQGASPYEAYTITSNGHAGTYTFTQDCGDPVFDVDLTCSGQPIELVITNNGDEMLDLHSFEIIGQFGYNFTPANNSFFLQSGETVSIPIAEANVYTVYFFGTFTHGIVLEDILSCGGIFDTDRTGGNFGTSSSTPADLDTDFVEFNGLSTSIRGLPDWSTVETCDSTCVPYVLYHTDETEDWEIFRLDGADERTETTFRQNLSFGEEATDLAPSQSPDGKWIVFASNRDSTEEVENWEIYVASTDGNPDSLRRVTYNTYAIDSDPVWGPNKYVVYESTRDGNWELYMLDMENGQEYRLTDHEADDINPYWSADGSKLLFESNRDGLWQIYELNLANFYVRRMTDGTAVALSGAYSPQGDKISYRTYPKDGENSVIYIMDADGRNAYPITSVDEDATNQTWSPDGSLIAYQSDLDGDLDVYIYEVASQTTRQLTNNTIDDYAPTWRCNNSRVVFTSDIMGTPDIFEAESLPILDPSLKIEVDDRAERLTYEESNDIYPQNTPPEENASKEGHTSTGVFGEQTSFLNVSLSRTEADISLDRSIMDWAPISSCPLD